MQDCFRTSTVWRRRGTTDCGWRQYIRTIKFWLNRSIDWYEFVMESRREMGRYTHITSKGYAGDWVCARILQIQWFRHYCMEEVQYSHKSGRPRSSRAHDSLFVCAFFSIGTRVKVQLPPLEHYKPIKQAWETPSFTILYGPQCFFEDGSGHVLTVNSERLWRCWTIAMQVPTCV